MSDISGGGPLTNGHQLGWICADLDVTNYVAQVIDLTLKKCTFLPSSHIAGECKGG